MTRYWHEEIPEVERLTDEEVRGLRDSAGVLIYGQKEWEKMKEQKERKDAMTSIFAGALMVLILAALAAGVVWLWGVVLG